jgi:hypothetical protein
VAEEIRMMIRRAMMMTLTGILAITTSPSAELRFPNEHAQVRSGSV